MVRGICSSLCYAFGYHAGLGFTADQISPLVWEATRVLESIGFKVSYRIVMVLSQIGNFKKSMG